MTALSRTLQNSASLRARSSGIGAVGAAQQDVGLDADRAQLLDRMLGRLGLQLAGRRDVGHQRQVDEDGVAARQVVAELADRLEERQASMSPTVPPISQSTKSTSSLPSRTNSLIASVTCGMTCTVAPR